MKSIKDYVNIKKNAIKNLPKGLNISVMTADIKDTNLSIVESVKSASPIFAPLAGEITEVNFDLEDTPELMNSSPYGDGWIVKMKLSNPDDVSTLMSADAYRSMLGE